MTVMESCWLIISWLMQLPFRTWEIIQRPADRNAMIYRLVTILERRGEKIDGKLEIALDENGQPYFTSTSNAAKKRFLLNFYGICFSSS